MTLELGIVISLAVLLVGLGVTWGVLRQEMVETRKDVREIKQFLGIGNGYSESRVITRREFEQRMSAHESHDAPT